MNNFSRGALAAGLAFGFAMQPNNLSVEPTLINASQEAFGPLPPSIAEDLPAIVEVEDPNLPLFHGGHGVGTGLQIKVGNTFDILTAGHVLADEDYPTFLGVRAQATDGTLGDCQSGVLTIGGRDVTGYHEQPAIAADGVSEIEGKGGVILSSIFEPDRALIEIPRAVVSTTVSPADIGAAAFVGEQVVFANYQTMETTSGQFTERGPGFTDSRNELAIYGGVIIKIVGQKAVVATNINIRYTDQNPQDVEGGGLSAGGSGGPTFVVSNTGQAEVLGMSDATSSKELTPKQVDDDYDVNLVGVQPNAQVQVTYIDMMNDGLISHMQQTLQSCE